MITTTPRTLLYSILFNKEDLTLFLLRHTARVDHLLSLSLLLGKLDLAKDLVRFDAVRSSENSFFGVTPLAPYETVFSLLFHSYDDETVGYFIDAGYNPNEMEPFLWTSTLHLAMNYNDIAVFRNLLEAGAAETETSGFCLPCTTPWRKESSISPRRCCVTEQI